MRTARVTAVLITAALLLCTACSVVPAPTQAMAQQTATPAPTETPTIMPTETPSATPDPATATPSPTPDPSTSSAPDSQSPSPASPTPSDSSAATTGATAAPDPSATPDPTQYFIYVEKGSHTITVYGKDAAGEYTVVVKTFLTATGKTVTRTPTGMFKINGHVHWKDFSGEQGQQFYAQYASRFASGLYIHSSLFGAQKIDRLLPYFYGQIGKDVTAGCLRTSTYAAWWIYTNCPDGTVVQIVNGAPKGTSATKPPDPIRVGTSSRYYDASDPFQPNYTEPAQ